MNRKTHPIVRCSTCGRWHDFYAGTWKLNDKLKPVCANHSNFDAPTSVKPRQKIVQVSLMCFEC